MGGCLVVRNKIAGSRAFVKSLNYFFMSIVTISLCISSELVQGEVQVASSQPMNTKAERTWT